MTSRRMEASKAQFLSGPHPRVRRVQAGGAPDVAQHSSRCEIKLGNCGADCSKSSVVSLISGSVHIGNAIDKVIQYEMRE